MHRLRDPKCHSSRRSKSCATSWRSTKSTRTSRKNPTQSPVKQPRMCAYQTSGNKNAIRQSPSKRQLYNCRTSSTRRPPLHSLPQASNQSSIHNFAPSNRFTRSTMSRGARSIDPRIISSKAFTQFRIPHHSSCRLSKPRKPFSRRRRRSRPSCRKSPRSSMSSHYRTLHADHQLGTSMASRRRRKARACRLRPK